MILISNPASLRISRPYLLHNPTSSFRYYPHLLTANESGNRFAVVATVSRRQISILPFLGVAARPSLAATEFFELPNSGGVKALELRIGSGEVPAAGDEVAIHYYGRLAAKQGWRFDSSYDHKDRFGESIPFVFEIGSNKVIAGIQSAVRSMKVGGIRRVVIPPSQGYQSTSQEPIPPNFFDRQRLFTTIFNPTRLANGEGSTLGTLIFDIELVSLRRR
ncbi:hypothetical protein MLD38_021255 [Melastoma candidum]|uniref:Uncharacterized protein n=1 Tax=Melastoma candidum TaxID=119954 RepID=A0ACB9QG18_9MYRT|nr:hypothetical protein MLD38_021255 [Melastoma candidum]